LGVLCHFQQYHGDQFTKPGANARHIDDRLGRHDIAEILLKVALKHQKFKLQQKIHNVPRINNI
jgi:hypothetical protein